MSTLLTLSQFTEIKFLEFLNDHNLGLFKCQWYNEMDEPYNMYPNLYLFYFDEEGMLTRAKILASADDVTDKLLHVQFEFIKKCECFIMYFDLQVYNF